MKLTAKQISGAIEEMAAIPYFPTAEGAKLAIGSQLAKFVTGPQELRWLVDNAISAMRRWQGVPELRGLYCTRYKPKDGIEAWCSLAGYTPEDSESGYLLDEAEKYRQLNNGERTNEMKPARLLVSKKIQ